jgi:hypothetical protein
MTDEKLDTAKMFAKRTPEQAGSDATDMREPGAFTWPDGQDGWRCDRCFVGFRVGRPHWAQGQSTFRCYCGKTFFHSVESLKLRDRRRKNCKSPRIRVWVEAI